MAEYSTQHTPLGSKDYFELKTLEKQQVQEVTPSSPLPGRRRYNSQVKDVLPPPGEKKQSYRQRWGAEAKRNLYRFC